jgi:hypothetical protein
MGLLFIIIGGFMYFHGNNLQKFYLSASEKLQKNLNFQRFLRFDLIFVLISYILSGSLVTGAFFRIFIEGFAVFG